MTHLTAPVTGDTAQAAHAARVRRWNATARPYPRRAGLAELFTCWSRRRPDAWAVVDGERRLSYLDLDRRANALAHTLVRHGIEPGQAVGVAGRRSAEAIVTILGIVKAGAVYVPLDTEYPAPRLSAMAEDTDTRAIVALPGADGLLNGVLGDVPVLGTDGLWADGRTADEPPPVSPTATGEDLAYTMFTSGSTGRPKAVGVRQRGIARLVINNTDYVTFTPADRVLHGSALSFDNSTFEIWGALLNGARLVVADSQVLLSPRDLEHLFTTESVTTAMISTAVFHHLAGLQPDIFRTLRNVVVAGEALNPYLARQVLANRPPQRLINGYGPTENTTTTTAYLVNDLPAEAPTVPIGTPIANTTCYIVRDDGTLAGIGEEGELVTGGDGVAAGYLNDPDLTAQRFPADPFGDDPAARLYRTGDVASWQEDGTIVFHGRRDGQFKIHGYRVEASEIESALLQHPSIVGAVVSRSDVATAGGTGDAQLVAYVVAAGNAPTAQELREHLGTTLPSYMIPAVFTPLQRLPLSPNGKINYAVLPDPPAPRRAVEGPSTARSRPIQERVRDIWSEVLRTRGIEATIGPEDTFFNVGGTSFDVLEIHTRVSALFGAADLTSLAPLDLFRYPTLRGYADHLASLLPGPSSRTP